MTQLATVTAGDGADTIVNLNNRALSAAGLYGIRPAGTVGLVLGYYGGAFNDVDVADGTVTLTGSATNYVVAHRTTGAVTAATDTTNWVDTTYLKLYQFVAGSASFTIAGTSDKRQAYGASGGGGGGGGSTQGKQAIGIMAAGIRPSVSGGCAILAATASASNQPDIITLDFDATTEEYAQFAIPMPKKWNEGAITARFRWSHAATTTNFGVVWGLQAVAVSDDDTIAASFGTAQIVTDTGGTTNDLYITAETSALTVGGSPAAGDSVFFRVYRKAADASDTMAIDARLHGVDVFVTTDADTDA
jgi:hypothetical protein